MRSLFKYLYHRWLDRESRWYPLLAFYYLTYRCRFRCPYCSNGFGQPYRRLPDNAVDADTALEILARIRRRCEHLVVTGGEPLEHPLASEILGRLSGLRFKTVALNTNGHALAHYLPEIASCVDTLIVSLDTLDPHKADAWFGQGEGTLESILANIETAAGYPGRRYEIAISAVATPNNIADIRAVYDYARARGFMLAVCPELQGVKPPAKLRNDPDYRELFDFLIREKRQGMPIFGSPLYLEHMRDFRRFRCHPFAMLVVDPGGQIFYPCLELGQVAGNLLDIDDLHRLRREAQIRYGAQPDCDSRCHSACALGFSLAIDYPWSAIEGRKGSKIGRAPSHYLKRVFVRK